MHSTQQSVTNGNFNLFVAPQSSSQSLNPLFTLEPSTTHSPATATRSLPMKQRGPLSSHLSQGSQEVSEHSEKTGVRLETDRVGNLHSKLKQEADKIRRWKTSMDMELKDKSEHIKEMTSLIEEQRKSLLEVQLEYEKVSGMLQEERGNQDQLGKQLTHTRELFSAVTEHVERVEQEVCKSGVDNDDLSNFQEQLGRRYEDLCENFNSLQCRCDSVTQRLEAELGMSRGECRSVREKNEALLEEIDTLTKGMCEKTQVFEERIEHLTSDLYKRDGLCGELKGEREALRSQLTTAQYEIEAASEKCEKLNKTVADRENEIREKVLISEKYQNNCSELNTELDVVRSSKSSLEAVNTSLQKCIEELEERGNKLSEKLADTECREDKLATDLVRSVNELGDEKNMSEGLRGRLSDLEEDKLALEDKLSSVLEQLEVAAIELKELEEKLRDQLVEMQKSLESLILEKEEDKQSFLEELSSLKLENERVVREKEDVEKMYSLSEQLNKSVSLDNEVMKQRCEEVENLLNQKTENAKFLASDLEKAESVISNKSLELEKLNRTIKEMELEREKITDNHSKEVELLNCRYNEKLLLHSEEVSNLKSLHQSSLQSKIESCEQSLASEVEGRRTEMERVMGEKMENENELNSLKQQFSSLQEEFSLARNSAIESKAQLCAEKEQSEKRVSELCSSLCVYKQESENIVSANNKQLAEMKLKHSMQLREEVSRVSCELNEKLESVRTEKDELEATLSKLQKERKQELSAPISNPMSVPSCTPKLAQTYSKHQPHPAHMTPSTPRNTYSHSLPPKTRQVHTPVVEQVGLDTEPKQSREVGKEKNFRTPSIHPSSSIKQKRKKIRLDDVSMEILNSQDDTASSKVNTRGRKRVKNDSTPKLAKENIQSTPQEPSTPSGAKGGKRGKSKSASAKSKLSKEYNWFDSDMVFGLGTDD